MFVLFLDARILFLSVTFSVFNLTKFVMMSEEKEKSKIIAGAKILPLPSEPTSMRPPRPRLLLHRPLRPVTTSQSPIVGAPLLVCIRHNSSKPTEPPQNLPSSKGSRISTKAAEYIDTLQLRALAATQRLNDITGYTSIESLKSQIQSQGPPLDACTDAYQKR